MELESIYEENALAIILPDESIKNKDRKEFLAGWTSTLKVFASAGCDSIVRETFKSWAYGLKIAHEINYEWDFEVSRQVEHSENPLFWLCSQFFQHAASKGAVFDLECLSILVVCASYEKAFDIR